MHVGRINGTVKRLDSGYCAACCRMYSKKKNLNSDKLLEVGCVKSKSKIQISLRGGGGGGGNLISQYSALVLHTIK